MTCPNIGLTGGKYCNSGNPMGIPTGIWPSKAGSFAAADFIDQDKMIAKVKGEKLFPIRGNMFKGLEDISDDPTYHTYLNKTQDQTDPGIVRLAVHLDLNECQKKQILKFNKFNGQIFIEYGAWLRGSTPDNGVNVRGMRVRNITVEKAKSNTSDGAKGTHRMVIEALTYMDFEQYDYAREMPFDLNEIDGLTEVDLTTVGTPTATAITLDVASNCYGENFGISGLVAADFVASTGVTITSVTESTTVQGRYAFVVTGLANDATIDLVAPASISAEELYIKSSGPVVVAGIV